MRSVEISPTEPRMDCREFIDEPINPLPTRCPTCRFPDIDAVPQPYFLVRSRTHTPQEIDLAHCGNFLMRERVRRIVELLAPGDCLFFPTFFEGTTEPTPWTLAVPVHQHPVARVDPSIPRCPACGEPRYSYPASDWTEWLFGTPFRPIPLGEGWTDQSTHHIWKSATWTSSGNRALKGADRGLFLSLRLLRLLEGIGVRGFHEALFYPPKPSQLDESESAWIQEQRARLAAAAIPLHAAGSLSKADTAWLRGYLKSHRHPTPPEWDRAAIERRLKVKLPKSYVDFMDRVGPQTFENVDGRTGFTASVAPEALQLEDLPTEFEDEATPARPMTFATTEHGDLFCFDVQKRKKEWSVLLYDHETASFQRFADNFAACLCRFLEGQSKES